MSMHRPAPGLLPISARPLRSDADYWAVWHLLIDTVAITPEGFNWDIRRWEGRRFYNAEPEHDLGWKDGVQLWETAAGRLVGVVNREGSDQACLQVHPDYRHMEPEMISWAEAHLSAPTGHGSQRQLHIFAYEYDALRRRILEERGYERMPYGGVIRHMRLGQQPLRQPDLAVGYTLRQTRPDQGSDCQRMADLLNAAFNRDFHTAQEYQVFTRLAPSFLPELDLVAEAPDGSFAAYVGIPYDKANRLGIFEPVCTHPAHRRRGLAQALMLEGLHRLRRLGGIRATVETGDMEAANRLYDSIGFTEVYRGSYWRRLLPPHEHA